eukprot:m.335513 g.335513  ORF g.335513 m.335513 type:complete len:346 (+) comp17617_c0_seq1:123-1160(+)
MDVVLANLKPIAYAVFNIVSVTGIVAVNKKVFRDFGFHFPITLVLIHTIITFLGLWTASMVGAFDRKTLPVFPRLILALSFVFYNGASLLNLNVNTVGFYQISKILVTPTVMLINLLVYGEGTTTEVKVSVVVMLLGVGLATVTDVDVTMLGFIIGMAAVVGAAQQQIFIGRLQKTLKASANQLLVAYTPFVVVMLAIITPVDSWLPENENMPLFQSYQEWYEQHGSTASVFTIILSGCLGLLVSLSTFLMIGATSPLTYNIVGHLKTVSILATGVLIFGDSMSTKKFLGILLALSGVIMYSRIKLRNAQEQQRNKKANESTATKLRAVTVDPLDEQDRKNEEKN